MYTVKLALVVYNLNMDGPAQLRLLSLHTLCTLGTISITCVQFEHGRPGPAWTSFFAHLVHCTLPSLAFSSLHRAPPQLAPIVTKIVPPPRTLALFSQPEIVSIDLVGCFFKKIVEVKKV